MTEGVDYRLSRFIEAQTGVYEQACAELRAGDKYGHWMWFIFPQIAGLGQSAIARKYAISGLEEARAYLDHPTLGRRLRECCQLVLNVDGRSAEEIFGYTDALKFRSCLTLFERAAEDNRLFRDALQKYYDGKLDNLTLDRL